MAQRDSGHKRIKHDVYQTPAWVTEAIIPHLKIDRRRTIWEPAAGDGQMVKVLRDHDFKVQSSDIRRGRDFLKKVVHVGAVVTNPPYSFAQEFIEHALACTEKERGIVALLLRVDFDSGSTRRHLFAEHPAFSKKVVLTKRIEWFKPKIIKGKKPSGPSENHCWMIWRWTNHLAPTIGYAP